jgi:hypothetical protein
VSTVPELRRAALLRVESVRDPRVAEVLQRSAIEVRDREGAGWESSDGTVRAVDVRVLVDGYALGLCERWPGVRDGVVAAVTAEAPRVIGASVIDLVIAWGLRERGIEAGYRDDPGTPELVEGRTTEDVRRAVAGFVAAFGEGGEERALAALGALG